MHIELDLGTSTASTAVVISSVKGPTQPQLITHLSMQDVPKFYGKRGGHTKRSYVAYDFLYRHKGRKKQGRRNYPPLKSNSSPRPSKPLVFTEVYGKPKADAVKGWLESIQKNAGIRKQDAA